MEKEIIRVKECDFQHLLDVQKKYKRQGEFGCTTIGHDWDADEYVLVASDESWPHYIITSAKEMTPILQDFEEYLEQKEN